MKSLDMIDKVFITAFQKSIVHKDPKRQMYGRFLRDMAPGMTREMEKLAGGEVDTDNISELLQTWTTAVAAIAVHMVGSMTGNTNSEIVCVIANMIHTQMHKIEKNPIEAIGLTEAEIDAIVKEFYPDDEEEIKIFSFKI